MRIDSSNVNLSSTHTSYEQRNIEERLFSWVGNQRPNASDANRAANSRQLSSQDLVTLSARAAAQFKPIKVQILATDSAHSKGKDSKDHLSDRDKLKIELMEILLEKATGKKIKIKVLDSRDFQVPPEAAQAAQKVAAAQQAAQSAPPERAGWGVEYDYHESYRESETMTFSARAIVRTADGKEIAVDLDLSMSREFASETNVSVRLGDAVRKDPLVINFSGTAAHLTDTKYSFDIDSDGTNDQISFVGQNSGFLAVDNNGDGVVTDGSELFGPSTGDGFAELAAHDIDGNQWIDEADPIFDQLRIWTKDAEGNDTLLALGATSVGAIYLGNISTQFDIKDASNKSLGQVQSSSIYVGEDGEAGTVQHIDLTV